MKTINVSKKLQADLSRVYMFLYKKLVAAYQSNGNSVGQSQFNAICVMHTILMAYGTDSRNPAVKFLFKLYNTHRGVVAKKTMISPNKDDVITPVPKNSAFAVACAISLLEDKILSTYAQSLTTLYRLPTSSVPIVKNYDMPKRNFHTWLGNTANPADIQKLQRDPKYFGQLYNKYVMRQTHR